MTDIQAADLPAAGVPDVPAQAQAVDIQALHAAAVRAGRLQWAGQWGKPYIGYLLIYRPPPGMVTALAALQDQVLAIEPDLLRQPAAALHATIGFLIPPLARPEPPMSAGGPGGRPSRSAPPDEIWQQRGASWLAGITAAAAAVTGPIRVSFRRLVATDAAIIAVAAAPNPVTALRTQLTADLDLLWPLTKGPLLHVSLFRYRQPLRDPARLLSAFAGLEFAIDTGIDELLLVRETSFPLLEYEVVQQVPIGGRGR